MATYNGARYVEDQLRSILDQLDDADEIIVVDDASRDDTVARVEALADHRIVLHQVHVNQGYAAAFEIALERATGEHLVLADQDDVWPPGRLAALQHALADTSVVAGNLAALPDGAPLRGPFGQRAWRLPVNPRRRWRILVSLALSNVPYFGSAMALRASFRPVILPYPASARELPDAWIAINALMHGQMGHVRQDVTLRRLHDANTSGSIRRPVAVLRGRLLFLRMVRDARRRLQSDRGVRD
jgi:glycosyltransferase involved in cell wall biosynthesis